MIDNHLYKVLKQLIRLESHYYQKIERGKAVDRLIESGVDAEVVDESLALLAKDGYIKSADIYNEKFCITPKAHATVEEMKRTRMMFWLPVIISITALIFSLLPMREILQALIEAIPRR